MTFIYRHRISFILAFIKFVLPFVLQNPLYELHRNEMLYLEQGNHLAWGFLEVPPMLSVFSKLTLLAGGSFFWVKFWPSCFGAINVFLVCKIASEMGGKFFAQFIAGLCLITTGYLRVHFLFQPGFLEIFFWSLSAYFIIRYINTKNLLYIYLLAVSLALGWLSKYSVLFFAAGIFAGLLLTPNRRLFTSKHLYFAALITLVIVIPNVLWQYNHKWPVVHHMKELRETQLQYINPFDFLKEQILMNLPCFFVWIGGLFWLLFSAAAKSYRILACIYITVIVLFIATNGKGYYTLGAYPMLFAAGGVWLQQITSPKKRRLQFVCVAVILLLFVPLIPVLLPVWKPKGLAEYYKKTGFDKTGILKWEDLQNHPLPQDFADMIGWEEFAQKAAKAYQTLNTNEKEHLFLFCDNYGQAGALNFYGKKYHLPKVFSDNASFLYWLPDNLHINNLLLITDDKQELQRPFIKDFSPVAFADSITNIYSREHGSLIILLKDANADFNKMFKEKINNAKTELEN